MKKLITIVLVLITINLSAGDLISFRTHQCHYKLKEGEWTDVKNMEALVTVKDNNVFKIYTKEEQTFYLRVQNNNFTDKGREVYSYKVVDNNGVSCNIFIAEDIGDYEGQYTLTVMYSDVTFNYYMRML